MSITRRLLASIAAAVLVLGAGLVNNAAAGLTTDQADYTPGSTVTIHGLDSEGVTYLVGEAVHVDVVGPNGYTASCDAVAGDGGAWACDVVLNADDSAIGAYSYTATSASGTVETGTFTDEPEPAVKQDVTWTRNGTTSGACDTVGTFDDLAPAPGEQGWLFILTSPYDGNGSTITATFSGGFVVSNVAGDYKGTGGGSYHYAVYAPLGRTLVGAVATNGTQLSNLTVSHCEQGTTVVPPAADLAVVKTATPSFSRDFTWDIDKSVVGDATKHAPAGTDVSFDYSVTVTKSAAVDSGWAVNGTITVTNPNVPDHVTGVQVTDATNNGGVCTVVGGSNATLTAQLTDFSYSCTYASAPAPLAGTNTVTVTWPTQDLTSGAHLTGSSVSYDAAFDFGTTTPTITGDCINVTDSVAGALGATCVTHTFTYSSSFTAVGGTCTEYPNTATIVETDLSDDASVTVCGGSDLTVSKTATPSFTRTYDWDITKDVDKTVVKQVGGTATFNYTVNAWQTGYTDSAWRVTGDITITNPNDWEAITLTSLGDVIDNGGDCTVAAGPYVVPASGSLTVGYTCTYAAAPAPAAFTNTATAVWDDDAYFTPTGSATGTRGGTFATADPTRVNRTVHVTDSHQGALGTLTATDTTPFASATFNYSRTITVPAHDCLSYPNTATITETGQSADQTVKVCGPAKTGALTMGFWQNKNGQALITKGHSTSGVCDSGTYLRQFAPFQDLSATATCTQVATYVTTVIKAANASGASMNAMLKGQMLATALDVFFIPGVGGTSIDLTKICTDLSCTAFEDSSGVFGGSPKTVSAMLTYAASMSTSGGTVWYAQSKFLQELAKDAFDAINNEKAFAP